MSEIKPALTEKEWADGKTEKGYGWAVVSNDLWLGPPGDGPLVLIQNRHAAAALCLHEQPFGFTREDVEVLEGLVVALERIGQLLSEPGLSEFYVPYCRSIADRIEALLPPESEG